MLQREKQEYKIHILEIWLAQQVKSQYGGTAVDVLTTAL
jgi:hypothetical protein